MNFQDTSKSLMDAVAKILAPVTTEEVEVSAAETTEEVVLTEAIKVKTHKGMYSIKKGEESLKSWVEKIVIMSDDVKKSQRKTITQNIVKAIESGKIKNADLTQDLGALIGVKSGAHRAPGVIVKAELKRLGLLESADLEEASNADLKKVLATTRKLGAIVKGNTADFGQGAVIDFSIEKGKIKFDGGLSSGVEYYNNAKDEISALMIGVDEATDLEEAIVYRDIRHAIELLRTTPGATKFRDSLMKKDQDAKISSSDLKKAKEIFANMSTIDSANVEKKRKDRYFPRFGVKALEESTDLEEAIMWWTVTITKKAGKLFKGQTVDVKARNSAEAIKKGIKQMKGNPILVPSGSVDAALFSIKESVNENRAIVHNPKGINAFIRQVEKKFPQYKGEIEQLEDDEIIFPDDEKLKKFFKGAREVKFVLADAVDLEETAATTQMVIKALKLKGGSKATALAQKLSAPEYVNAPLPKSVINTAKKLLKGQITKFVKEAADLEKTNVLSSDEYDEVQNFKNFNKRDWKWDKKKSLYVRKKKVNEAADLEEAASPFKSLEAAWLRTAGDEKKQARLIKKHNLKQIISKVRPGAIKLGVMNDLNAKGKQNYTAAGLDADGELIFVTNNPTKIYYPKSNSKRPEGLALESIEFTRVKVIVERVTGVADVDFIVEYEVNSSWPASAILNAYTKYKILNG